MSRFLDHLALPPFRGHEEQYLARLHLKLIRMIVFRPLHVALWAWVKGGRP